MADFFSIACFLGGDFERNHQRTKIIRNGFVEDLAEKHTKVNFGGQRNAFLDASSSV